MEFLLELLTEEIPASHIRSALDQLAAGFRKELGDARIGVSSLEVLATPRRLVVAGDLAAGQEDREEVVTGPPLAIAKAPDGTLTPAGRGFARSQSVDESLLEAIRTPKGEYLGFKRKSRGTPTSEVLAAAVPRILGSLTFPKMMRWAESPFRFSRPIHGLLCVFDGRVVPTAFEGFRATDTTVGHRIAAPGPVKAADLASYRAALEKSFVVIDPDVRKKMIVDQIEAALAPLEAGIYPDPGLLDDLPGRSMDWGAQPQTLHVGKEIWARQTTAGVALPQPFMGMVRRLEPMVVVVAEIACECDAHRLNPPVAGRSRIATPWSNDYAAYSSVLQRSAKWGNDAPSLCHRLAPVARYR